MAKVTMKSTKEVMMNEIERLTAEIAAAKAGSETVVEVQEAKRVSAVKDSAKKIVDMEILAPSIVAGYNDVQEAIAIAVKELEEITGIKDAIINLEAVLLAGEKLSAEQKEALTAQNTALRAEAELIIAEKEANVKRLEQDYADRKAALEKERKREQEEYAYTRDRNRQKEEDEWEDLKATREKELKVKEQFVAQKIAEIEAKEENIAELQLKVNSIPDLTDEAYNRAYEEAKKSFDREKAIEVNAVKKNSDWEIKVAKMEKDRAVEDLTKANEKIANLEAKLEAAYASMNTLATTTVQSTGGVKILETGKDK